MRYIQQGMLESAEDRVNFAMHRLSCLQVSTQMIIGATNHR